jgi:hypothetical protein
LDGTPTPSFVKDVLHLRDHFFEHLHPRPKVVFHAAAAACRRRLQTYFLEAGVGARTVQDEQQSSALVLPGPTGTTVTSTTLRVLSFHRPVFDVPQHVKIPAEIPIRKVQSVEKGQ